MPFKLHSPTNLIVVIFEIVLILGILALLDTINHHSIDIFETFIAVSSLFILNNLFIILYLYHKDKSFSIQQKQLIKEHKLNSAIFNLQNAIIIVKDERKLLKANSSFFKTFNFDTMEAFSRQHTCICELFIDKKDTPHLQPIIDDLNWTDYIRKHPHMVHEVYILDREGKERIFSVDLHDNIYSDKTMVVLTDITEIKHQYETFERLFESSTDGLLIMKGRRYIAVNNTLVKMLGFNTKEEILNLSPLALFPIFAQEGQRSKASYKRIFKTCLTEGFSNLEGIHTRTSGEMFWCDIAMTKIKVDNEDAIHIRWRDIDEYKKLQLSLEEQVQQQAKALIVRSRLTAIGEMMENITHQWKQPLSIILNLLGIMKLTYSHDKNLSLIEEQTQYLNQTIRDFNAFSNHNNPTSHFNLQDSIQAVIKIFEYQAQRSRIRIDTDITQTASIQGDLGQFNQALLVILSNAKDALLENRTEHRLVHIKTRCNHSKIKLTICNNGGIIPETVIHKIFEPYFTTKFRDKGTGIGLSMTYNIIQKSNGTIEVKNYNEGVVFTITLPIYKN